MSASGTAVGLLLALWLGAELTRSDAAVATSRLQEVVVAPLQLASATPKPAEKADDGDDDDDEQTPAPAKAAEPTPEEKMARRHPQPARVGDLIGLPVLDGDDRTIGRVTGVVRTTSGKVQLIVPYGGLFGFGQRLVPVPIEAVAILGRQIAALDMPREQFETAPTWYGSQSEPLGPNETIRIAVTRR